MADPITRDAMWDQILKRIMGSPAEFRNMNTDPNPMPIPEGSPSFVPESSGPSLAGGAGGGGVGGFVKKHPILTALAGLGGTAVSGAVGGPKFRLGMAEGMKNIGPNIAHALNTRRQMQAATDEKQQGRDTMLARMGLYKGKDETLKAISDQARQDREGSQLKSTPEGVFRPVTSDQATQNAISDIQTWMEDHPQASIQEKLAYHNQRSAQRDKEIQDGWAKIADPAGKEIIPVTGGYLDSKRVFHQTSQEPKAAQWRLSADGKTQYRTNAQTGEMESQPAPEALAKPKKPIPAAENEKLSLMNQAVKGLDGLETQLADKDVSGSIGPVAGRLGVTSLKAAYNPKVATFLQNSNLTGQLIARMFERGVISNADREFYISLLPNKNSDPEVALANLKQLRERLKGVQADRLKSFEDQGYNVGGFGGASPDSTVAPAKPGNIFRDKLNKTGP